MAYSIKKHEVDRFANVAVQLNWRLEQVSYAGSEITVNLIRGRFDESIKASMYEVARLLNVAVANGWSLEQESYAGSEIMVKLIKKLSPELLKAAGELDPGSSPQ